MDRNTELILIHTKKQIYWEDEEKSTNDLNELRKEFKERLYGELYRT